MAAAAYEPVQNMKLLNEINIEKLIDEISSIFDIIQKENIYAASVGDNINLYNSSNTHCKTIAKFDWSDIL